MSATPPPGAPDPYRPPPMGPVTTKFARIDPGPSRTFGAISALITVVGAVLIVVAFTAVDWFSRNLLDASSSFSDIRSVLSDVGSSAAAGPAQAYFGWLGWTLFAVTLITALIAAVPTVGDVFRVIAPLFAAAGVVLTFLAIRLVSSGGHHPGYGDYLSHAAAGFYLALAGFVLMGLGGALGPQRSRS